MPEGHQRHFCTIFRSQYLGSLASMGTIITLVLGLFISLVVSTDALHLVHTYSAIRSAFNRIP